MPRNIQGKPTKVESRKAEPKEAKPKDHKDDKAGTVHEESGDKNNHPDARKNPEAFPAGPEAVQLHHDRLRRIEDHLGLKPMTDNMGGEDQAKLGKGKEVGHVTEKKGSPNYGRKRH